MGKYQIKKTSNDQYRWVLRASNGQIILTSETYATKQGCQAGIESSKNNTGDKNFDKKTSVSGQPYFNQISNNHQVIGTSEMYSSTAGRDNGIESVKRNAPSATTEDLS